MYTISYTRWCTHSGSIISLSIRDSWPPVQIELADKSFKKRKKIIKLFIFSLNVFFFFLKSHVGNIFFYLKKSG